MIYVEGYKAFHGVMRISPLTKTVAPFEKYGDWLYKPNTGCWYGCGRSFEVEICNILRDDAEWILTTDRLPEEGQEVEIRNGMPEEMTAIYEPSKFHDDYPWTRTDLSITFRRNAKDVTHWRPLIKA